MFENFDSKVNIQEQQARKETGNDGNDQGTHAAKLRFPARNPANIPQFVAVLF